ncbi:MAG: histidinol-phosphate transaminase [Clostridia bacterium]|nr:histidinol-phosphate transaminase [Clostridia bacterium]
MSIFKDKRFSSLKEYTPGEQPQDKKYIKLNTNESPYSPSPAVLSVINSNEAANLKLYSDPTCSELKKSIAAVYGVDPKNVFVSNGSDEILNFAFMLYGNVAGAVFPNISYGFYKVFGDLYGIDYKEIPLLDDFTVNVEDYKNTGKFTVLANPNAPTGIALSLSEIEQIVASNPDTAVLIDEAYIDFGGESCYKLIDKYSNLIVCQTFSKSRSMAGARLGFCFADEEIIKDLELIKYSTNPYNINRLTAAAGVAAMSENGYYLDNCQKIIENRDYTKAELEKLGFWVLDSKANFLFAKSDKIAGEELYLKLKDKGVLVRHFTAEKIKEFNRITIGSREQMEFFVAAVKEILGEIQ